MAAFTVTNPKNARETTVTKLDLSTGPHTFTYNRDGAVLYLLNGEASAALSVVIDGQNVGNVIVPGQGQVNNAAGVTVAVANGALVAVDLDRYRNFMGAAGNTVDVTITGATTGNSFGWITQQ